MEPGDAGSQKPKSGKASVNGKDGLLATETRADVLGIITPSSQRKLSFTDFMKTFQYILGFEF